MSRLTPRLLQYTALRYASTKSSTDKSRILEKPTRFNPPSHGARQVKPRMYPGPKLTVEEERTQSTRRYPNMLPPEGTFMHWFVTNRSIHLWITLSVLTTLAGYAMIVSFLNTTAFRHELPSTSDMVNHPIESTKQFMVVYKMHTAHQSEIVAEKRRQRVADGQKRKEFQRAHGIDPAFLTGSWMSRFGTIENDQAREVIANMIEERKANGQADEEQEEEKPRQLRKKKVWLGIW